MSKLPHPRCLYLLVLSLLVTGCSAKQGPAPVASAAEEASQYDSLRAAVLQNHARGVHRTWALSSDRANDLLASVQVFLAAPDDEALQVAKAAWISARKAYSPSEVFRFQGGPIDDEDGPEGQINGWPLDEAYIDYVIDQVNPGLIQDRAGLPSIDAAALIERNEVGGEENIATGWHAVEFLLWGQDVSAEGPGSRSHTDYLPESDNASRRGAYLEAVSGLLVEDLKRLALEWAETDNNNYRKVFVERGDKAVAGLLTGLAMLAGDELAGERIAVAFETRDQEDEQSCFSDTTHLDIIANIVGMQQMYRGTLGGQTGPGPRDLVASFDGEAAQQLDTAIHDALVLAQALTPPFDQAIQAADESEPRAQLSKLMTQLEAVAQSTAKAAEAMALQINLAGH